MNDLHEIQVPADSAATRLDKLLADAMPDISRSRLKALIKEGNISLNGKGYHNANPRRLKLARYILSQSQKQKMLNRRLKTYRSM